MPVKMEFSMLACFKYLTGTLLACVSFFGWVLVLVNTSLLHEDCGETDACDNFFRRYWWSLLFQFGVMAGAFMLWASGTLNKARAALTAFLALVTVQHIELAGKLLTALDDKEDWPPKDLGNPQGWVEEEAVKGNISGFVILVFANMMYMLLFGIGDDASGRVTTTATTSEPQHKGEEPPSEEQTPPV